MGMGECETNGVEVLGLWEVKYVVISVLVSVRCGEGYYGRC